MFFTILSTLKSLTEKRISSLTAPCGLYSRSPLLPEVISEIISSEMSEMMAICDRRLVLCDGVIKDEYLRKDINDEEILENAIQQ